MTMERSEIVAVYDSIPPKAWDVHVWSPGGALPGRIDKADAYRIITMVLGEFLRRTS